MEAYFRVTQKQSGGGSGATITVTYSSSFYGKTMTCSDGVTTYTATTTSSGSTTFNVNAEGTWTVTCDGLSRTVAVVLNYMTEMALVKTITVYSAANDTLSFTDLTGSKTVTTDSSGAGSVSVTYLDGDQITFTSSVAKDPADTTFNTYYSKQFTFTSSTNSVYVMPENCVYWYGYMSPDAEELSTENGWSTGASYSFTSPTYNTNYARCAGGSYKYSGIAYNASISGTLKAITIGQTKIGTDYGYLSFRVSKYTEATGNYAAITSNQMALAQVNNGTGYICIYAANGRALDLYAMWYE